MNTTNSSGNTPSKHSKRGQRYSEVRRLLDEILSTYFINKSMNIPHPVNISWLERRKDSPKIVRVLSKLYEQYTNSKIITFESFTKFINELEEKTYLCFCAEKGYFDEIDQNPHSDIFYGSFYGNDSFIENLTMFDGYEVEELPSAEGFEDDPELYYLKHCSRSERSSSLSEIDLYPEFLYPMNLQYASEDCETVEVEKALPWIKTENEERAICIIENCTHEVVVYAPPITSKSIVEYGNFNGLNIIDTEEIVNKTSTTVIVTSYYKALSKSKRAYCFIPSRSFYEQQLKLDGRDPNKEPWIDMYNECVKYPHSFINRELSPTTSYEFHIPHD